jgi:hypothetical protein
MSNAAVLGAIEYEAESAWGEDVTTFATHQLSHIGEIDVSGLTWAKEDPGRVENYRGGGSAWVKMAMGGSFKTKHDMVRGVTMVGSPSISAFGTLWGIAVGNVALSAAASTTLTGGTAAVPTTTASGTFSAGGLCRVGALGDGDGNGQFYAIATHTTTTLTLIGAMDGAPVNGAVLYPVEQIYPSSSATATDITGTRFRFLSGNIGYEAHGCFPTAVEYSGDNTGERPQATITWGVSWWRHTATTLPSAVTSDRYNPAVVAAGSFNFATVGTTTRTKYTIRNLSITHTLAVTPQMGPGGVNANQAIVGAKRSGHDTVGLSFTVDADAATATPAWHALATGTDSFHLEMTLSTSDATALGFKCPKVCITNIPVQKNEGGINRLAIEAQAYVGGTVTNDLTRAQIVWGLA